MQNWTSVMARGVVWLLGKFELRGFLEGAKNLVEIAAIIGAGIWFFVQCTPKPRINISGACTWVPTSESKSILDVAVRLEKQRISKV